MFHNPNELVEYVQTIRRGLETFEHPALESTLKLEGTWWVEAARLLGIETQEDRDKAAYAVLLIGELGNMDIETNAKLRWFAHMLMSA